jgi:Na+/H+ antiporter
MDAGELGHVELILLLLLVLVAALAVLAKRLHVAYPIVVVLGGLALSLLPGVPRVSLNPNVVFLVILPPLLFSAAFHTSWRDFRDNLVSILMLAFGLVGFTIYGVASTTRLLLPGFDWKLGLVLGAVVATTDAIAATATAKRLGLPRRITDLLEAESLVNDGSGLVALKFTLPMVVMGVTPSVLMGVGTLLYLILVAVIIGIAVGFVIDRIQRRIADAPVEITISLITPFVAYLGAEWLQCSGVLATLACGIYLGRRSSGHYSLHARIESIAFWRTLDFILNGLVFLLLGLQLPAILSQITGYSVLQLVIDGAAFSGIVIMLRLLWVYPGAWISRHIRHRILRKEYQNTSPRSIFLVGWAGMRGVLALAAALSLPEKLHNGAPFPQRSLIIFLTFSVIFATLVLQGLTMPALIRRLGLAGISAGYEEELIARKQMILSALQALAEIRARGPEEERGVYDQLEWHYRRRLASIDKESAERPRQAQKIDHQLFVAQELRDVERAVALQLRDKNQIHDEVLRRLEHELDLLDARFAESEQ